MSRPLLSRLRPDPYILGLLSTVVVATVLPASGGFAGVVSVLTNVAIGLLFFLYGARLSAKETVEGLRNWRLHLTVFLSTFALFPLLGLAAGLLSPGLLSEPLYNGVLYLCFLPSTVQSSIAFTSTARGNIAAAICSASLSSLLGIALTPLLVGLLIDTGGAGFSAQSAVDIVFQLLIPFLLGQFCRRWIGEWMGRHQTALGRYDRGTIFFIVYTAFSQGVVSGIWQRIAPGELVVLAALEIALLAAVLASTHFGSRLLGFPEADRTAIVFCGSKKSLATGLPMANVLFPGGMVGLIVLPVMLFHQLQLIVCAMIANRKARASEPAATAGPSGEAAIAGTS